MLFTRERPASDRAAGTARLDPSLVSSRAPSGPNSPEFARQAARSDRVIPPDTGHSLNGTTRLLGRKEEGKREWETEALPLPILRADEAAAQSWPPPSRLSG